MSRIPYISALLLVLFVSVAATAQERGDGEAAARRQIHDKDVIDGRGSKGKGIGHGRASTVNANTGKNTTGLFRKFHNDEADAEPPLFSRGRTELGLKVGVNFQEMAKSPFSPTFTPGIVGGGYVRRYFRRTGIRGNCWYQPAAILPKTPQHTTQSTLQIWTLCQKASLRRCISPFLYCLSSACFVKCIFS